MKPRGEGREENRGEGREGRAEKRGKDREKIEKRRGEGREDKIGKNSAVFQQMQTSNGTTGYLLLKHLKISEYFLNYFKLLASRSS